MLRQIELEKNNQPYSQFSNCFPLLKFNQGSVEPLWGLHEYSNSHSFIYPDVLYAGDGELGVSLLPHSQ